MIIDEVDLTIKAGKGGNGHVSFRREKYVPRGGPDGGNGGRGGSVYFEAVSDLTALRTFKFKNKVTGNNGVHGLNKKRHGANAEDIIVKIPVGTKITDKDSGEVHELEKVGERILIARGGRGGRGNFEFRSNENKAPQTAEDGRPGQEKHLNLNLQFIADIGLIGLPSAGKSSLLNALTKTDVKVGAYPFTTLEPNLGELNGVIIADIPGLIEGAHTGKGLGTKFLKHIRKTGILLHCIDCSSDTLIEDYRAIRSELDQFSDELTHKKEVVVLTKTDLCEDDEIKDKIKLMKDHVKKVMTVSIIDDESLEKLKKFIVKSV